MFFPLRSHYPEIQTVAARHTAVIIEQNIVGSSAFSSPQTPIKPCGREVFFYQYKQDKILPTTPTSGS